MPIAELVDNVHIYSIMQASNGKLFCAIELPDNNGQIMRSENGTTWQHSGGMDGVKAIYDIIEAQEGLFAGGKGQDMGGVYQSDVNGEV